MLPFDESFLELIPIFGALFLFLALIWVEFIKPWWQSDTKRSSDNEENTSLSNATAAVPIAKALPDFWKIARNGIDPVNGFNAELVGKRFREADLAFSPEDSIALQQAIARGDISWAKEDVPYFIFMVDGSGCVTCARAMKGIPPISRRLNTRFFLSILTWDSLVVVPEEPFSHDTLH